MFAVREPAWVEKFYPHDREELDRLMHRLIVSAYQNPNIHQLFAVGWGSVTQRQWPSTGLLLEDLRTRTCGR